METTTIHQRLISVQSELKAPKSKTNSFAKYKYRSCEDILESAKPLLKEHGLTLTLTDSIEMVGSRYYVKATATIHSQSESLYVNAYAREPEDKKGSDESQITGAASSYARKYALNGLFLIDDTQDADTQDNTRQEPKKVSPPVIPNTPKFATSAEQFEIAELASSLTMDVLKDIYGPMKITTVPTGEQAAAIIKRLKSKLNAELDSLTSKS